MTIVHDPNKKRTHPIRALDCCSLLSHIGLLGDLEQDAIEDTGVAQLLPRIRRLLTGQASNSNEPPWWAR